MTKPSDRQSAEAGITANIANIAEAVNTMNLAQYGNSVTADFVNMNKDLQGKITSTVTRQARLDELKVLFEASPYAATAVMVPTQIYAHGDRAFAHIDGILTMMAKENTGMASFKLTLDLYLSFLREDGQQWLSERSMGIERSRADL